MNKISFGYKNDEIFLLSGKEYEELKNFIPLFGAGWWLRKASNRDFCQYAAYVDAEGLEDDGGHDVEYEYWGVRPAIHLYDDLNKYHIGQRIIKYNYSWIILPNHIAIAETLIATHRFNKLYNDYEHSEIRQFLNDWLNSRRGELNN